MALPPTLSERRRRDLLRKELEKIGAERPLLEWGQRYKDMAPTLDALEAELLNTRIAHGIHPGLAMCAANAVVTQAPTGTRKLDKSRATGRIDETQALVMAMGVATHAEEALASVYDGGGFMFV